MITRIRNAYLAGKKSVSMPYTRYVGEIAKVLQEEKYIKGIEVTGDKPKETITLALSYVNHTPAVSSLKRISKPGVRMYKGKTELRPVLSGMGIAVLSTSQGVMTSSAAKKKGIGGEVLFELW